MNNNANKLVTEGVIQFHRGACRAGATSSGPRQRKWVFAGMLAAAAGVLVWRCVSGPVRKS